MRPIMYFDVSCLVLILNSFYTTRVGVSENPFDIVIHR